MPYDDVVQGVFKGYAKQAKGCVAEMTRGFSPDTFTYTTDLDKAKQLLQTAGVPEGTKLTMRMESGLEQAKGAAQLLQSNLSKIGIDLQLDIVDLATFTSSFYGDAPVEERPNMWFWFWWPDYNDAWNHCYPQVSSEAWGSKGANAGFYKNDRVDQLLATAKDAPDDATYFAALAELQQIISRDDPPAIYYAQPQWTTLHRKDVTGVVFNPIAVGTYNFWKMGRTAG
jgi:peptide/nickel transport system substrate-binding protein